MKLQCLLRASLGALCAASGASAQGVVSQLGGFLEQTNVQVDANPENPLALFEQPTFQVASPPNEYAALSSSGAMAAAPAAAPSAAPSGAPKVFAKPKGLLTLRSMRVSNTGAEGSKIFFGTKAELSMGTDSAGNFVVQQSSMPAPVMSLDSQGTMHLRSKRVEALSLNALQGISVRGVQQWQLVYSDDFSAAGHGWSRPEITQCGGVSMLGGFCKFSIGEVNKTFSGLPPHKQLRVVASYHFIDRWIGETGYMKMDVGTSDCMVPVWSEQHSQQENKNGISLCGDAATPEGKFSSPVDVTVPHTKDSASVSFGSTMSNSDPCDESWGISSVEIYVRA